MLSWGHGGQGQLGHGSVESKKLPTLVEAIAHERVIFISCGGSSSAAVTGKISSHTAYPTIHKIVHFNT